MWLDGLYMGGPVCAEYGAKYGRPDLLDLVVHQALMMEEKTRDEKTGLLYHAWDFRRKAEWADPVTGRSPEFWGRSIGSVSYTHLDVYKRQGLKWYNEVYRRGLMDPDSINNDRPTQKAKVDAGYAMVPSGNLPGWAPSYLEYYIPGSKIYYSYKSPYGGQLIGINAATEKVDTCLKFLDMLADPDAYLWVINGEDGERWESDGNGNAFITEKAMNDMIATRAGEESTFTYSDGEKPELWNTPWIVNTGVFNSYMDGEGNYRVGRIENWKEVNALNAQDETFQKWIKTTGYNSWKEWLGDNYVSDSALTGVQPLCTLPDPTMQLTVDALRDTVVTASWKMVYANSDEEFESIWETMVADCEGLDAQSIIDWRLQDLENAKAIKADLESGN